MTDGVRVRVSYPEEGAPPADDARKVLLNAAPVAEDAKRAEAAVVGGGGKQPPLQLPDGEEVRDVTDRRDASSEAAAMTATTDPSAMDVMTEEWHRGAEHPSSYHAAMVCVAARDHSRKNEEVPTPQPMPKPPTKSYYCCHCCWHSG